MSTPQLTLLILQEARRTSVAREPSAIEIRARRHDGDGGGSDRSGWVARLFRPARRAAGQANGA